LVQDISGHALKGVCVSYTNVDFIDVKDVDVKACVKDRWWGHLRTLGDT
jgi:hypothetical protein